MKARNAALQGALAAAGLVVAYATWQRPAEERDVEAVVLDLGRAHLELVRYQDPKRVVELAAGKDGSLVREQERAPAPVVPAPPDPSSEEEGAPPPPLVAQKEDGPLREYKGSEAADRLFERFAPLRAVRALGVLPEAKLAELGFDQSVRVLEVRARGAVHRFQVSTEAHGAGSPYLRREDDGRVFLVRGTLLSDLEFAASRLVDRRLHAFRDDELDGIRVHASDRQRQLWKVGEQLASTRGGVVDELASNWHERLWRLVGVDVLGRGEEPAAGAPEVQLKVEYLKGERPVGFIELGKAGEEVFARTEHTAGWVRLAGTADQILKERDRIIDPG